LNDKNRQNRWLSIRVSPNAGRSEIAGLRDGVLQIKVAAPPVEGKANKELIDFLSKALEVRKSSKSIVKGQTGRNKVIAVEEMSRERVIAKIQDTITKSKIKSQKSKTQIKN